jgi:hypothetical protein
MAKATGIGNGKCRGEGAWLGFCTKERENGSMLRTRPGPFPGRAPALKKHLNKYGSRHTQSVCFLKVLGPMTGENRQIVTDEPVEFEKEPVEVQDCRKITHYFRKLYRIIYPNLIKGNRRMSTCTPVGLANTRISTGYA